MSKPLLGSPRYAISPLKLQRVLDHIDSHLAELLDLATLARVAGLSRFHFSRVFAQATGKSPYAFVVARRVEKARALLGEEKLKLATIAQRTGFGSAAQLTVMFRHLLGVTPSRYRKCLFAGFSPSELSVRPAIDPDAPFRAFSDSGGPSCHNP